MTGDHPVSIPRAEPVFPEPGPARDWVRDELAQPEYRESLLERVSRWFEDLFDDVESATVAAGGLDPMVAVVLLALVLGALALALSRLRANPAPSAADEAVFAETRQTAEEHRRRARTALDRRQWDEAVVEAVRALASTLFERGLMPEQPGVTVDEITGHASRLFPASRSRLEDVAVVFDETRYGEHPADEARAVAAADLEVELSTAHPATGAAPSPAPAVPR